jgi:hypothetical protein
MRIDGPDIAPTRGIVWIPERLKVAGMSIKAHSRFDFPAGAVTAAASGDQIETDVSRYRGVIPFRDVRIPVDVHADGRI